MKWTNDLDDTQTEFAALGCIAMNVSSSTQKHQSKQLMRGYEDQKDSQLR